MPSTIDEGIWRDKPLASAIANGHWILKVSFARHAKRKGSKRGSSAKRIQSRPGPTVTNTSFSCRPTDAWSPSPTAKDWTTTSTRRRNWQRRLCQKSRRWSSWTRRRRGARRRLQRPLHRTHEIPELAFRWRQRRGNGRNRIGFQDERSLRWGS